MSPGPRDVMTLLASARPARLEADATQRAAWPDASQIIDAAGPADNRAVRPARTRRDKKPAERRSLAHPGRRKLLGALSSAVVTAAVIAVAVAVGSIVTGPPHGKGPVKPSRSVPTSVGPLIFHALPLDAHWRGEVTYAARDGVVYLAGSARPSGSNQPIATLPPGARPATQIRIVVALGTGRVGLIVVTPTGLIEASGGARPITLVSLSGVSFVVGAR